MWGLFCACIPLLGLFLRGKKCALAPPHTRLLTRVLGAPPPPPRSPFFRRLFPGVLLNRIPYRGGLGASSSYLSSPAWWSIVLLAIFNAMDTVGRTLPSWPAAVIVPERALLAVVTCRFVFVPLFIGIAEGWTPWLSDLAAVLFTALFALSNGYLASLAVMRAPQGVDPGERETAGFLLSLAINLGIVSGSQLALTLK